MVIVVVVVADWSVVVALGERRHLNRRLQRTRVRLSQHRTVRHRPSTKGFPDCLRE
jgi:hypothetical protein